MGLLLSQPPRLLQGRPCPETNWGLSGKPLRFSCGSSLLSLLKRNFIRRIL